MRLSDLLGEATASAILSGRRARDIANATRKRSNAWRSYQSKLRSLAASNPAHSHSAAERRERTQKLAAERRAAADRYENARTRADDAIRDTLAKR